MEYVGVYHDFEDWTVFMQRNQDCDIVHCYGFYICCTCSEELIQTINKMWNVRFVWMFVKFHLLPPYRKTLVVTGRAAARIRN